MLAQSLTVADNEAMAPPGCAQCGGHLPADRKYAFFCSEPCQQAMDAYIVARIKARPKLQGFPRLLRDRSHVR